MELKGFESVKGFGHGELNPNKIGEKGFATKT
jgi:hypothetical protein